MPFHPTTGDLGDNEGNKSLPAILEVISVCRGQEGGGRDNACILKKGNLLSLSAVADTHMWLP